MNSLTELQPVASPVKAKRSRRWRCVRPVALVMLCLLVLNTGISLLINQWLTPVTVSFDMKGTIDRFMDQRAGQTLSETRSAQLAAKFSQSLEQSLNAYQRQHRAVILVTPSVVGGAEDITPAIQQAVAQRMREAP